MFEWAAMTKQRWSPVVEKATLKWLRFEFWTYEYCDVCIIILCVQTICIIPLILYAMKYVNVVLYKSVDLV